MQSILSLVHNLIIIYNVKNGSVITSLLTLATHSMLALCVAQKKIDMHWFVRVAAVVGIFCSFFHKRFALE